MVKDTKEVSLREAQKELIYLPFCGGSRERGRSKAETRHCGFGGRGRDPLRVCSGGEDLSVETGSLERQCSAHSAATAWSPNSWSPNSRLRSAASASLACIGLDGAMAHAVSSRTREIGIRIAVGASAWDVIRMVLRQSLSVTGLGILFGLPEAMAGARLIAALRSVALRPAGARGLGWSAHGGWFVGRLVACAAGSASRSLPNPALRVATLPGAGWIIEGA